MKKFLFDLFPLILFFVAYRFADIYVATAVAMAAGVAQILYIRVTGQVIETMHWVNLAIIVLFGGATLYLHDEAFIKWKPTVLYWLFAGVLIGSQLFFKRNTLKKLLGEKIALNDSGWFRLNMSWGLFFLVAGALNLFVAFSGWFTQSQWVSFKVFGLMGLLVLFVIAQSIWLSKHMLPETADQAVAPNPTKNDTR